MSKKKTGLIEVENTETDKISVENSPEREKPVIKEDAIIETTYIYIKPRYDTSGKPTLELPVYLQDPILGQTVELMPSAEVSAIYADMLINTYDYYERGKEHPPMSEYLLREDYKLNEMVALFKKLNYGQRIKVLEFTANATNSSKQNK